MTEFVAAMAADMKDVGCRQTGVQAQSMATARDQGKSFEEAIALIRNVDNIPDEKAIREMAELLFHRFRRMTPEDAAFEFYMDCLDNG